MRSVASQSRSRIATEPCSQGHLHRGGVEPVAEQDGEVVAPQLVDGLPSAAQRRVVDDVVVDQGRGVDQLDHRGVGDLLLAVALEHAGAEQQQGRAHALAAAVEDVLAGFLDERHVGGQAFAEQPVGRGQLVRDQGDELFGFPGFGGRRGVEQFVGQARASGRVAEVSGSW